MLKNLKIQLNSYNKVKLKTKKLLFQVLQIKKYKIQWKY